MPETANPNAIMPFTPPAEQIARGKELAIGLAVSPDRMQAYLTLGKPVHPDDIAAFLEDCGFRRPFLLDDLQNPKAMTEAILQHTPYRFADHSTQLFPLADADFGSFQPMIDAWIHKRFVEGVEKAKLPFTNIEKGGVLGTFFSMEALESHQDIYDVFGTLRADKRKIVRFKPGTALAQSDNGQLLALESGYLDVTETTLHVRHKFTVNSLSDWAREPLNFIGTVELGSNVIANYDITAGQNIIIDGSVEEASLYAEDTITLGGGIIGKAEGGTEVYARNWIKGRYVNNAKVLCDHDIELPKGCYHSIVHSHGKLNVEGGPIVGGQVYGAYGILANEIGGSSGVKTFVGAGFCQPIPNSLDQLISEREIKKVDMAEWIEKAKPILQARSQPGGLNDKMLLQLKDILDTINGMKKRIEELDAWIEAHDKEACEFAHIEVKGDVFPGVSIMINNVSALISEKMTRVSFRFDAETAAIRVRRLK